MPKIFGHINSLFDNNDALIDKAFESNNKIQIKLLISAVLNKLDSTKFENINLDKQILSTPTTSKILDTMSKVEIKSWTIDVIYYFINKLGVKKNKYSREIQKCKIWTVSTENYLARFRFCDCLMNSFYSLFDWDIFSLEDLCIIFEEIYLNGFSLVFKFENNYYTNIKCLNKVLIYISKVWEYPLLKVNINPTHEMYLYVYGYSLKDEVTDFSKKIQFIKITNF